MEDVKDKKQNGVRRLVWLSNNLDDLVEDTRKTIGLSRSSFIKTAILRYLESIGVISTKIKEGIERKQINLMEEK